MRFAVEIGGVRRLLDPAAISAVRYRAEYGRSVVTDLADADTHEKLEACLVRMTHAMLVGDVDVLEFAAQCRRDSLFVVKGLAARNALLDAGPPCRGNAGDSGEAFDEYRILALMATARLDMGLLYELPILHLMSVASLCFGGDDDRPTYRKMSNDEIKALYGR